VTEFLQILMWIAMLGATAVNMLGAIGAARAWRTNMAMRKIIWAYEKELLERGVTLPPRCVHCCQVLPRHVEGCDFADFYQHMGRVYEFLSRPPIKYYPKGERPPQIEGK